MLWAIPNVRASCPCVQALSGGRVWRIRRFCWQEILDMRECLRPEITRLVERTKGEEPLLSAPTPRRAPACLCWGG